MTVHTPERVEGQPRILIYDLEVSPLRVWTYGRWQANALWVDQEQYLMSFAYKWYGEKKTYYLDLRDQTTYEVDKKHDTQLIRALFKVWQAADVVIAYNGDGFDQKMCRTFFMRNDLVPKPIRSIDPMKIAKKEFRLSSNSMKQVAVELGVAPKMDVPLGHLTQLIIEKDCPKAWREFKKYNIQDVDTLEQIWEKIRPYASTHINMASYSEDMEACPRCGESKYLIRNGYRYTNAQQYQEWYCKKEKGGCGHYPRRRLASPITKTTFV